MLSQALDKLVIAIESALVLNPELLDQSDARKRAYWRDMLCPALQEAKVAKARAININDIIVIAHTLERTLQHAQIVRQLASMTSLPDDMVRQYTHGQGEIEQLLKKINTIIDCAAVETLVG